MSIETDALMAVTGVVTPVITPRTLAASQAVPAAWEKRLRRWVTGDAKDFRYHAPPNLDRIWQKLALPPEQTELEPLVASLGLDPMAIADYFLTLIAARNYVVEIWPKFSVDSLAGPKILPLSEDDGEEVAAVLGVLEDPERLLEEMESRTLTASQIAGFKAAFPDLYAFADKVLDDEIAAKLAKDMDWSPGWEAESVLRVFRGSPPEDSPPPPAPPPAPERPFKIDPEREKTQGQVSSAPKGK